MCKIAVIFLLSSVAFGAVASAETGARSPSRYYDILNCVGRLDLACTLDKTEDFVLESHKRLLVEADNAVAATARKSDDEVPSSLIESISSIFTEITEMLFKNGLSGIFRDGKDDDSAEIAEEEDDDDDEKKSLEAAKKKDTESKSRGWNVEEGRGKKKKKKKAAIKLLLLGMVLYSKICLLLKLLGAHLQIKFLMIAAAGLLINAARFYWDLKKGHSPQKVIYYEHAQHQHHYENDDDWSGGGGHGGYWGRSYDDEEEKSAQDIAYAKQKPTGTTYSRILNTPNFSWI